MSAVLMAMFGLALISCRGASPEPPAVWSADGVITDGEYASGFSDGDYELFWLANGQYIYIGIRAKSDGWVAVGFQPKPLHRETDTVLGLVRDGEVSVFDMFSTAELGPCVADTELGGYDDILDFGGREEGDYTTIEFKRLLITGDEYDGELLRGANQVIWAYSLLDDPRQRHIARGYGVIELR